MAVGSRIFSRGEVLHEEVEIHGQPDHGGGQEGGIRAGGAGDMS